MIVEGFSGARGYDSAPARDDGHFHRIAHEYHEVNRTIQRAEIDIEPLDDFHVADLRKRRSG